MKGIKKYSYKDISIICDNLANLYEDGIQITKAIELLDDFPLKKQYKESIRIIRDEIERGETLGESFSNFEFLYPKFLTGMISIGEKTGRLTFILKEMGLYYKRKDTMRKEIINASIYPIFLTFAMILISIFFFLFIIPELQDVYSSMESEIPNITRNLLGVSKWINENPFKAFLYIGIWGVVLPIIILKPYLKKILKIILSKVNIIKDINEYEMILLIKVIVSSGINISLALKYCEEDSSNEIYSRLNEGIIKGELLSKVIEDVILPSKYTIAMIKLGEESGSLDERLNSLTEVLSVRCNERFKKVSALLQPSIIIIMSFMVVAFLGIFVLPMFDGMYGGIS
ncbi:MAG: type II secretion system F family protein [Clostridium sp.]|uniref:type II secretion system F family protein n=1 Tax=Clostridium sp. TaxID=1506 RepID=UPI003F3EB077